MVFTLYCGFSIFGVIDYLLGVGGWRGRVFLVERGYLSVVIEVEGSSFEVFIMYCEEKIVNRCF